MTTKETEWLLREKYNGVRSPEFERDLERLSAGEPLGYVIGFVPFLNTNIFLDSHPLIPRPETEHWVERAIEEIRGRENPRVLDLCAGSGCIGIAVLNAIPDARVDFAEIERNHHETIRKNIRENGIDKSRTHILEGNLFEHVTDSYHVILSNPPYIDPALSNRVEISVSEHEPHGALFGGEGGMELIERILREAPEHLNPKGLLYIEHEPEQEEKIKSIATTLPYIKIETFKDQFDVVRFSRFEM